MCACTKHRGVSGSGIHPGERKIITAETALALKVPLSTYETSLGLVVSGRCPTGDDPMTSSDETNCEGVEAAGEFGIGQVQKPQDIEATCVYDLGLNTYM